MKILCINTKPDLSYFTNRKLNLDVTYETIPLTFPLKYLYKVKDSDGSMVDMSTPDCETYLKARFPTKQYDIILIGWNPADYGPAVLHTGGFTNPYPLSCGTYWCTLRQDTPVVPTYAIHEMHHALVRILWGFGLYSVQDFMDIDSQNRPFYLNDQPENPLSNYAQTWAQIAPYLDKLNNLTNNNMYKYFKDSEVVGLKPEFVALLDKARGIAGVPFKITSGYRDPAHNTEVGGVEGSSHTLGLAVDLAVSDGVTGGKILLALAQAGLNRFGFYNDGHIHVDYDMSKPNPCYWVTVK